MDTAFSGPDIPQTHSHMLTAIRITPRTQPSSSLASPGHTHTHSLPSGSPRGHGLLWPDTFTLVSEDDSLVPRRSPTSGTHHPSAGFTHLGRARAPRSDYDGPRILHPSPRVTPTA